MGGGGVPGQTPENVISPGRNPEAVGGGGYREPWKSVLGLAVVDQNSSKTDILAKFLS